MKDATWTPAKGDDVLVEWLDICGQSDDLYETRLEAFAPMTFTTRGQIIKVRDSYIALAASSYYDQEEQRFTFRESLAIPRGVILRISKLEEVL